jgi:FkbM family methyltransferase
MFPALFRFFIPLLIVHKVTYLPGMVLVRMARKWRKNKHNQSRGKELTVVSNFAGSLKMQLDKNSYMGGSIYWTGYHHINEFLYLQKALKEEMFFVDAGANQGEFTLLAASKLSRGKVFAFEPVSANFFSLTTNIQLNALSNVEAFHFGLLDKESVLPIYTSLDEGLHAGRHEGLSTLYTSDSRSTLEEEIDLKVFDDLFFDQLERFDFLKIDVEGAELYALKGMQKSLEKFHPEVLIEMNSETFSDAGYSMEEMVGFFQELGYKAYKLHRGNLVPQSLNHFEDWGNSVFKYEPNLA